MTPRWFKSSYSNNGGACVEVATNLTAEHGIVPVRDSKAPTGPVLHVPTTAFATFVAGIKDGSTAESTTPVSG
ncbi:DUF397 domain-containing protein [Streptomyces sp. NPDC048057]|uniref:DUF397 domain-containing protein n=1 Tax=Streptomyces sp. NPDC048057 TaxID=3155628 RepID=UPI0033D7C2B9